MKKIVINMYILDDEMDILVNGRLVDRQELDLNKKHQIIMDAIKNDDDFELNCFLKR